MHWFKKINILVCSAKGEQNTTKHKASICRSKGWSYWSAVHRYVLWRPRGLNIFNKSHPLLFFFHGYQTYAFIVLLLILGIPYIIQPSFLRLSQLLTRASLRETILFDNVLNRARASKDKVSLIYNKQFKVIWFSTPPQLGLISFSPPPDWAYGLASLRQWPIKDLHWGLASSSALHADFLQHNKRPSPIVLGSACGLAHPHCKTLQLSSYCHYITTCMLTN